MFRLVCLVEDKKLVPVLKLLVGQVVNMEPPQPIVSESPKGSKSSNGRLPMEELLAAMPKDFTVADFKAKIVEAGYAAASYSHFLTGARKAGLVIMLKNGHGQWRKK